MSLELLEEGVSREFNLDLEDVESGKLQFILTWSKKEIDIPSTLELAAMHTFVARITKQENFPEKTILRLNNRKIGKFLNEEFTLSGLHADFDFRVPHLIKDDEIVCQFSHGLELGVNRIQNGIYSLEIVVDQIEAGKRALKRFSVDSKKIEVE